MSRNILELNNVSFEYEKGNESVKDVSFSVSENSTTILIGPNGSGKTTLLKMMVGLLEPKIGEIKIEGERPKKKRDIIGYVPQKLYFDQSFPITVIEFLKLSSHKNKEEILQRLESLKIDKISDSLIGKLSGGQLQRVLIARSLLNEPKILFFDEPVSGIDVGGERNFYELIKDIQKKYNVTVVMVSHDMHVVSKMADQIICLNKEMLCSGGPEDIVISETVEDLYGKGAAIYKHHHH